MLVFKILLREKKNWLTGISIAIIIGLILGLNQGINSYSSINIDEMSSQIDVDIRVSIRTENYVSDSNELRQFLDNSEEYSYLDSLLTLSDDNWIFNNSLVTLNISNCYICGTEIEKYLSNSRSMNDLTFIEENLSSPINSNEIIISRKLAIDFSLGIGDTLEISYNDSVGDRYNDVKGLKIAGIAQKHPSFKSYEMYEGPSNVRQIVRFGNIFPVDEDYFILGNLTTIQDFLTPVLEDDIKFIQAINIFFGKELELTKLNNFLRQMSKYNKEIFDFLRIIDSSGNPDILAYDFYLDYFLSESETNIRYFKYLILLNLLPVFIFGFILIYSFRDSVIFSNLDLYELYTKRGLQEKNFFVIFLKESILLSIIGMFIAVVFSEFIFEFFLVKYSSAAIPFSFLGFFQRLLDSGLTLIILFVIESVTLFLISIRSFKKYHKNSKLISSKNRTIKSDLIMLAAGVIYPLFFFIATKYNLISFNTFLLPILDFIMQLAVGGSVLLISKSLTSLFGKKVFTLFTYIYSSIFKRKKKGMSLTNLLYNYKNSAYVASIIFLLSFSISYFVMGTVIQDNSDNWIDDISYQKVGGDLTASRLIEGKYNATENASIYEFKL